MLMEKTPNKIKISLFPFIAVVFDHPLLGVFFVCFFDALEVYHNTETNLTGRNYTTPRHQWLYLLRNTLFIMKLWKDDVSNYNWSHTCEHVSISSKRQRSVCFDSKQGCTDLKVAIRKSLDQLR